VSCCPRQVTGGRQADRRRLQRLHRATRGPSPSTIRSPRSRDRIHLAREAAIAKGIRTRRPSRLRHSRSNAIGCRRPTLSVAQLPGSSCAGASLSQGSRARLLGPLQGDVFHARFGEYCCSCCGAITAALPFLSPRLGPWTHLPSSDRMRRLASELFALPVTPFTGSARHQEALTGQDESPPFERPNGEAFGPAPENCSLQSVPRKALVTPRR
jgi:hypothetical protein